MNLPRHEADLSTQEAAQEPHARLPQADEERGRSRGHQASASQGAQAAHLAGAEEVAHGVRLARTARLRRRREFLEVQQRGRRIYSGELLVLALDSGTPRPRIGITVSSKVGNAVERNRVKRWIREGWREVAGALPAVDVVVIARPAALGRRAGSGARRALAARPRRSGQGEAHRDPPAPRAPREAVQAARLAAPPAGLPVLPDLLRLRRPGARAPRRPAGKLARDEAARTLPSLPSGRSSTPSRK